VSANPPVHQPKPLMKVPEVADLFDVEHETVRVWARTGKLRSRKNPGGRVLVFRRADVEALLEDGDEPSELEAVPGTPHAAQTERRAGDYSTDSPQMSSLTGQSSEGTTTS
jgi:hypothetical protein